MYGDVIMIMYEREGSDKERVVIRSSISLYPPISIGSRVGNEGDEWMEVDRENIPRIPSQKSYQYIKLNTNLTSIGYSCKLQTYTLYLLLLRLQPNQTTRQQPPSIPPSSSPPFQQEQSQPAAATENPVLL